jgi:hypothetical protein
MKPKNRVMRELLKLAAAGGMLLQIGPCTGDNLRDALEDGTREVFNGIFKDVTDAIVAELFN